MKIIDKNGLKISSVMFDFVNNEAIPGTGLDPDQFWAKFSQIVHEMAPTNKYLIEKRETIQKKIDDWHKSNKGKEFNKKEYIKFLKSLDYLIEEKNEFKIETSNVDEEISSIAGPQLVVPVDNARYALNAANARWGSLYDALYGTDMIDESDDAEKTGAYNPIRGNKVIAFAKQFLDQYFQLQDGSFTDVVLSLIHI